MKKKLALLLSLGLCVSTMTVTASAEEEKTYKIGVCQLMEHDALDATYNGFVEGLKEAGEYALKNNIRLTLEAWNRYETYLITKLDMALKMVNEVGLENVGVMGDTFHMNIEESNMGDAIRNVGKKLYYLHIADSNRAAPGRGHIDFEEIAQALKDIDYNGWISMELLPAAANPFSGIVQEEFYDQYTEESITYLKKLFS